MAARRGASVRGKPLPRGGRPRSRQPAGRDTSVVVHPDGWYWIAPVGHQQFGPFDSVEAVIADMDARDAGPDTGQTLNETEREIGQLDWIDPETGALAEDTHLRLEDH